MGRWKRRRRVKNKPKDDDVAEGTAAAAADGDGGGDNGDDQNKKNNNNNKKNKAQGKQQQGDDEKSGNGRRDQLYNMIERGCLRMETYYALQGLHNWYWDDETNQLKACLTDEQKEEERQTWLRHMKSILPSSFRLGADVDVELRQRLEHELDQLVGTEMEIWIETNQGGQQKRRTPNDFISINNNNKDTTDTNNQDTANTEINNINNADTNTENKTDDIAENHTDDKTDIPQAENPSQGLKEDETTSAIVDSVVDGSNITNKDAILIRKTVAPAKKIPYVPHAYQISLDRNTIRRNPCLQKFHNWLKIQTAAGFITRQETVSMIPPVVLAPESHHVVLDLCAAPGSKTSQLLEVVSLPTNPTDLEPQGCVVANDADPKRAHMLVHQMRRINSPAVLVTNCDAQFFPILRPPANSTEPAQEGMFDRVLCDVPCTGDGTARKNPHLWKQWSQGAALALHPLQLNICLQGARLTKVGGYLCYSTCSMNPLENEAVVAEVLRQSNGALQLVEKRPDLPGLRARPGWSTWRVLREIQYRKEQRKRNQQNKNSNKTDDQTTATVVNEDVKEDDILVDKDDIGDIAQLPVDDGDDVDLNQDEIVVDNEEEIIMNGDDEVDPIPVVAPAAGNDGVEGEPKSQDGKSRQNIPRMFTPPVSWDEATLAEMAKSAGFNEFKSFDDVPELSKRRVRSSCFPPTPEEAATFGLEKCLRCLPQDMDTGGFFVALLHKVAPMRAPRKKKDTTTPTPPPPPTTTPSETLPTTPTPPTTTTTPSETLPTSPNLEPELKRAKIDSTENSQEETMNLNGDDATPKENLTLENGDKMEVDSLPQKGGAETDPGDSPDINPTVLKAGDDDDGWESQNRKGNLLLDKDGNPSGDVGRDDFVPISDEVLEPLVQYYGLSPDFPKHQLMARAGGEAHKVLYFISRPIKTLIDLGIQKRLTVINSGLKSFVKNNNHCDCPYRVAQEGIQFLVPYITKRKVVAELEDFTRCLSDPGALPIESFSKPFAEAVRPLDVGSFVVVLRGYEGDFSRKMVLVMWRGRGDTLKSLVSRVETGGFKSKLRAIAGEPFSWDKIQEDTVTSTTDGEWQKLP